MKVDEYGCLVPGCHLIDEVFEVEDVKFELKLYPNPVSDYLNIFFRNHSPKEKFTFQITDISGKILKKFENAFSEETMMVPVWDYAPGVYLLQFISDEQIIKTGKVIISR